MPCWTSKESASTPWTHCANHAKTSFWAQPPPWHCASHASLACESLSLACKNMKGPADPLFPFRLPILCAVAVNATYIPAAHHRASRPRPTGTDKTVLLYVFAQAFDDYTLAGPPGQFFNRLCVPQSGSLAPSSSLFSTYLILFGRQHQLPTGG